MLTLFPNQQPIGIDLGNVEIKECRNSVHKFTLKATDGKAQFILFYDWLIDTYFICNQKEMPVIRCKRAISTNQVKKWAYFESKELDALFEELKTIIKNPKYIPGPYQETQNSKIEIKMEVIN
jgi:hypothetical protein